jgi:hypothetical protein
MPPLDKKEKCGVWGSSKEERWKVGGGYEYGKRGIRGGELREKKKRRKRRMWKERKMIETKKFIHETKPQTEVNQQ